MIDYVWTYADECELMDCADDAERTRIDAEFSRAEVEFWDRNPNPDGNKYKFHDRLQENRSRYYATITDRIQSRKTMPTLCVGEGR